MEIGGFITEGAEIVNHDNTLSGNGTVDSPLGVVPGYNETVLWSGNAFTPNGSNQPMNATAQMSESIENFDQIRLDFNGKNYYFNESVTLTNPINIGANVPNYICVKKEQANNSVYMGTKYNFVTNTTLSGYCSYGNTQYINSMSGGYWGYGGVIRVVGINRKQ